jgi:putative DNA primase/helicase
MSITEDQVRALIAEFSQAPPKAAINGNGAAVAEKFGYLKYEADDGGILDAWLNDYGREWLRTANMGWYRWVGTHWKVQISDADLRAQIMQLMIDMNEEAKLAVRHYQRILASDDANAQVKAMMGKAQEMRRATKRTGSRVSSVVTMAAAMREIPPDKLDNASLLNCQNGTLNLETMELRPHDWRDLLTHCLSYDYDPEARSEAWEFFLKSLEPETADFFQEFAGYALTPDIKFEIALWLYGPPGGGKSTALLALQTILGDKAGMLGLSDIERNRFALASLPGKTLMIATEQPASFMSSVGVLNRIISGEPITVEKKFKDAITITPRAKIAWAMNGFPRVGDANDGIFRRVKVVKLPAIPKEEQDEYLKDRIASQAAGVLNWAIAGLKRLRERGKFVVPEAVVSATKEFVFQNDIPQNFVDERCIIGDDHTISGSLLYDEYRTWALETGHKPQSNTSMGNEWRRLGFEKYMSGGALFGGAWR